MDSTPYIILLLLVGLSTVSRALTPKKTVGDVDSLVYLEHNIGDDFAFVPKGHASVKSIRAKSAVYSGVAGVTPSHVADRLRALVEGKREYIVRASVHLGWPVNDSHSVFSFAPACAVMQSKLSERLTLHLSNEGDVISVTVRPMLLDCAEGSTKLPAPSSFNTTCRLTQVGTGPWPDTESFIQKVQREEEMRQRNPQDNRSFIQKYWMYIVPVFIFMMLSSGQDARGGEGGGGGGGGGS